MKKILTSLPGVLLLEPQVFGDDRGFFLESYNQRAFAELGIGDAFVQDNHSYSEKNVVRGLHYQIQQPQGKLVRVISRRDSRCRARSPPVVSHVRKVGGLHALRRKQTHVYGFRRGFAHGFRVASAHAHVLYKATDFYAPEHERTVAWNDPALRIDWQLDGEPIVSAKDQRGATFERAEKFE